jgi:hypothetical protein
VLYREPHQQLVLGEVLSFYLAHLLGLRMVQPAVLSQVDTVPTSTVGNLTNILEKKAE